MAPSELSSSPSSDASPKAESASAKSEVARSAGRGGLAVAAGKIYFLMVGLVQQIALKHVLGLEGYGALSSAQSAASITYNPVVQTSIQGVSRVVASSPEEERPQALRRALGVHAVVALIIGGAFFALAREIAVGMGAPHITWPLRLLSIVVVLYGLYAPLVGALNGLRRFYGQAGLDVIAATLRTIGLIGGAYLLSHRALSLPGVGLLDGVDGAVLGFVGGAIIILVAAVGMVGVGKPGGTRPTVREHLGFIVPLLLGQGLLNLLFQADALLLRRFASDAAVVAGLAASDADPIVGAYRAAQLFCFLPYQLLMSVTFILFPMLAQARSSGDRGAVKTFVKNGVRLSVVVAGVAVAISAGLSHELIHLVFGADAAVLGATAMRVLAVGLGFLAIFGILTSVLNSLGGERASLVITGLAFLLVAALCFVTVRGAPYGESLLVRTAWATSAGLLLATAAAAFLVFRIAGGVVAPLTVLRVALAVATAAAVGALLPSAGRLMALPYSLVVASIYVTVLVLSRELGSEDLAHLKAVIRR